MRPDVVYVTTITNWSVYLYDWGLVILSKNLHKNYSSKELPLSCRIPCWNLLFCNWLWLLFLWHNSTISMHTLDRNNKHVLYYTVLDYKVVLLSYVMSRESPSNKQWLSIFSHLKSKRSAEDIDVIKAYWIFSNIAIFII